MPIVEKLTSQFTWRTTVSVVLLAMMGMWAWATGHAPIEGQHGFVLRQSLVGEVQTIVGKDIDDLKKQQSTTEAKVDSIKSSLDAVLADLYAKRIFENTRKRCKATDNEERARLFNEINKDVNLYRIYSGDSIYQKPTCDEV